MGAWSHVYTRESNLGRTGATPTLVSQIAIFHTCIYITVYYLLYVVPYILDGII